MRALAHIILALTLLFAGVGGLPVTATAQTQDSTQSATNGFDWDGWNRIAKRAVDILEAGEASTPSLEILRGDLATWRGKLIDLRDTNDSRIKTIQDQIAALGTPPEDGTPEAPEIAQRRKQLGEELTKAREPQVAANEAFKQADGLIREIDTLIRTRLREDLITRGASPLMPSTWAGLPATFALIAGDLRDEVQAAWNNTSKQKERNDAVAFIIAYLVIGLVLMTRAGTWLWNVSHSVWPLEKGAARDAREQFHLLLCALFPLAGILLLLEALRLAGFEGIRLNIITGSLLAMAASALAGRWLGRALFEGTTETAPLLAAKGEINAPSRRMTEALGLLYGFNLLVKAYGVQRDIPFETVAALGFVTLLISALIFGRLAWKSVAGGLRVADAADDGVVNARMFRPLIRAVIGMCALGGVLGALGYYSAAQLLVYGPIESAAVLGGVLVLQKLLASAYVAVFPPAPIGDPEDGDEHESGGGLVPVLIAIALFLAALPLLALSWGARTADLVEYWTILTTGVTVGQRTVSITDLLTFVIVFVAIYMATRVVQAVLRGSVLPRTTLDTGARTAITTGTGYVGVLIAGLAAISASGIDLSGIALVAGALSVGIGFGLQAIVSNFVSGIILLIERPVREGDWVDIGGVQGYVQRISVRATVVETFDRATVVIPNSDLISGVVTNYTYGHPIGRVIVPVGVAYGTDTRKVEAILREIAEAHPMRDKRFNVSVNFKGFGADSLDFDVRIILKDVNWMMSVKTEINHQIAERFTAEGIEIPYAQRDIHLRDIDKLVAAMGTPREDAK